MKMYFKIYTIGDGEKWKSDLEPSTDQIMGLYEPKSCCICSDPKNGSLILASLSLIGAILSCLSVVFGLLSFFLRGSLEPYVQNQELDPEDRENLVMDVCIAVLAFYTFVGVCSSLLIHGIRKEKPVCGWKRLLQGIQQWRH